MNLLKQTLCFEQRATLARFRTAQLEDLVIVSGCLKNKKNMMFAVSRTLQGLRELLSS